MSIFPFVEITEQMKRLHRNEGAFQRSLRKAPEVFQTVRMNVALTPLFDWGGWDLFIGLDTVSLGAQNFTNIALVCMQTVISHSRG